MSNTHDGTGNRKYDIDLLYPSEEKRKAALKRTAELERLPAERGSQFCITSRLKHQTPRNQFYCIRK